MSTTGSDEDLPAVLTLMPSRLDLPRGRAALPGSEVAASQQGRILQAVTEEVAARGYGATSVRHVIARARVSRSAFYASFTDKQDAFARAHLQASRQLLGLIRDRVADASGAPWRERLRAGIQAYLDGFENAPAYAVSFMVELRGAGSLLLDQRDQVLQRHARNLAWLAEQAAAEDPAAHRPPDLELIGAIGAADELATRAIRVTATGARPDLGSLLAPIADIHEAVLIHRR
ncbi:TetR/AcrR family transcriptional regulator [Amycolatopsis sp. cmx-4-83]|uniref:TetR/AcrR family transcriptional regulator n=1 Tax=Amycolatopsis sp. cmx-4-83 TaxID=2790940 RepID=UPI0039793D3B